MAAWRGVGDGSTAPDGSNELDFKFVAMAYEHLLSLGTEPHHSKLPAVDSSSMSAAPPRHWLFLLKGHPTPFPESN